MGTPPTANPSEDRCHGCNTPLASDQRYCVNCGERRGKSRFSLANVAAELAPPPPPQAPKQRRRPRLASGVTLVTGVATLLLALGVGVLIGHDNSNTPTATRASAPVSVVTVGGGGGAAGTATTVAHSKGKSKGSKHAVATANSDNAGQTPTTPLVHLNFKPTVVHLTPKKIAAAAAAATKVFGHKGNLAPPTIQPGQACSHGAGCQNGKFTGNFFHSPLVRSSN
jgi:hypothetical protein